VKREFATAPSCSSGNDVTILQQQDFEQRKENERLGIKKKRKKNQGNCRGSL
jgi:hypothetical protein